MSGLLFGGSKQSQSFSSPMEVSLRVSTSAYGLALPIVYGSNRVPGNMMWYGAFTAIPHTVTSGGGGGKGGGGGGGSTQTTYTYTASMMLGLSEGTIIDVKALWRDKNYYTSNGVFTIYKGAVDQNAWPYLTTNFASQALNYRGVAYAAVANLDLGDSSSTPNFSFEVVGILGGWTWDSVHTVWDAKPGLVLVDYLTNAYYGAGFADFRLGNWSNYYDYTVANGLFFSPAIDSATPASDFLTKLMRLTNSGIFYSEGLLKITPYGDVSASGYGAYYYAYISAEYDLTDDDFISDGSSDPVTVMRGSQSDAYNQVQIEFVNRDNQYTVEIAEAKDQANIEAYGLRPMETIKAHEIADARVARTVAQLILQRSLYIRNTYQFRLGAQYCLIEPTDYITITDSTLGLYQTMVRVLSIEENDDFTFNITAEDAPPGVSSSGSYTQASGDGHQNDYNISPGNTNAPTIFEAPMALTTSQGGLEVWIAASGGTQWGGCQVWVSYDGTNYAQIDTIQAPATMGILSALLPNGSDPDTTNTLAVDLTMSRGALSSGTTQDADLYNTLCFVDGEFISFSNATLTAPFKYNLTTYLRRGAYYSTRASHAQGTKFVRLNDALAKIPFTSNRIGATVYIKLPAYNLYGSGQQTLDQATAYTYTITGSSLKTPPPNVTSVTATFGTTLTNATVTLSWPNPVVPLGLGAYTISWPGNSLTVKSNSVTVPADWTGSRVFTIVTVDTYGNTSTGYQATVTKSAPGAVAGVSVSVVNVGLRLSWSANTQTSLPVVAYEVRTGDTNWGSTGELFKGDALSLAVTPPATGSSTTWYVRAIDSGGQYSATSSSASYTTVAPPDINNITAEFSTTSLTNATVTLRWTDVAPVFGLDGYQITYAGKTVNAKTNTVTVQANWLGNQNFTIKSVDRLGNMSAGYTQAVTKLPPNAITNLTSQIVDNTVMLYWSLPTTTTLPISYVLITKGDTYAGSIEVGRKSGSFTTINELKGGVFTYWVVAVDTDGNSSTPVSITATVAQPPNFVFNGQFQSTFTGTKTNAVVDNGVLVMCVNTSETYQSHFTTPGWSTPQDQINAGYSIYIQPGLTTGTYVEVFDYGTVLGSSNITVTPGGATLTGAVTFSQTISVSLDGVTYTDYVGVTNAFATNFRFVKVTLTATQQSAGSIYTVASLLVTLNSKVINDSGSVSALSTDALGTVVNFNKQFVDVNSITVAPQGTAPRVAVYDFKDSVLTGSYTLSGGVCTISVTAHGLITGQNVRLSFLSGAGVNGVYTVTGYTANTYTVAMAGSSSGNVSTYPNSMRVYVFDNSGTRQSATASWQIDGY